MKPIKVLFAGGGTGGHIYPALAMAKYVQEKYPHSRIEFVGSQRGLEKEILPKYGYKLHLLPVGQLHSSVDRVKQVLTLLRLPWVFVSAFLILIKMRPTFVLGVGGYASGPIVMLAACMGFRTALWEANVQPGMTNKILAKFVKRCFVVFEDSLKYFPAQKTLCVGYPVRQDFEEIFAQRKQSLKDELPQAHTIDAGRETPTAAQSLRVLIFGGSQGASVFNRVIPQVAQMLPEVHFILQTGSKNYEQVTAAKNLPANLKVLPFLDPIVEYYKQADLIICRSGAGAIVELSAMGQNCLFVPLPTAADDHQRKNAEALFQRKASDMILEKEFTAEHLVDFLRRYQERSISQIQQMQKNMLGFFHSGATKVIVEELLK